MRRAGTQGQPEHAHDCVPGPSRSEDATLNGPMPKRGGTTRAGLYRDCDPTLTGRM